MRSSRDTIGSLKPGVSTISTPFKYSNGYSNLTDLVIAMYLPSAPTYSIRFSSLSFRFVPNKALKFPPIFSALLTSSLAAFILDSSEVLPITSSKLLLAVTCSSAHSSEV